MTWIMWVFWTTALGIKTHVRKKYKAQCLYFIRTLTFTPSAQAQKYTDDIHNIKKTNTKITPPSLKNMPPQPPALKNIKC